MRTFELLSQRARVVCLLPKETGQVTQRVHEQRGHLAATQVARSDRAARHAPAPAARTRRGAREPWVQRIGELAEHVPEIGGLVPQAREPRRLLVVKVTQVVRRQHSVRVHVEHAEPERASGRRGLILLAQEEIDEGAVRDPAIGRLDRLARRASKLHEHTPDRARRECVPSVPVQLFERQLKVAIGVELAELAEDDVKVLIREEAALAVDVVGRRTLTREGAQSPPERRACAAQRRGAHAASTQRVEAEEDSVHHGGLIVRAVDDVGREEGERRVLAHHLRHEWPARGCRQLGVGPAAQATQQSFVGTRTGKLVVEEAAEGTHSQAVGDEASARGVGTLVVKVRVRDRGALGMFVVVFVDDDGARRIGAVAVLVLVQCSERRLGCNVAELDARGVAPHAAREVGGHAAARQLRQQPRKRRQLEH